MRKALFVISIIVLAVASIVYAGFFPVASINSDWLWQRDLVKSINAVEQLQRTSAGIDLPSPTGTTTLAALRAADIRRGVLEELIHEKIIAQELKRIDASQDWDQRVARDAEGLVSGKERATLEEATRALYGIDLNDFKRLVLAPQIREELLRKELELRAKDSDEWLEAAFQNARVKIYFLDYEWRDGVLIRSST